MNNCYLWMRDHGKEHAEEQDRSLPVVEVAWPTTRQAFQFREQPMLDDEELPELSLSDPDSRTEDQIDDDNGDNHDQLSFKGSHQHKALSDMRNVPGIPAPVASDSQSLKRTPHHKKFLSRSHNSLVFQSPDYSKVESKVRKYIDSMRQQQQQRRQRPRNQFNPVAMPVSSQATSSMPSPRQEPPEDVIGLKRQLADQEARVEVLQEDHDRLLLHNARLQNMMEEMRAKIRMQHAQQTLYRPAEQQERRTNSPLQPEVDRDHSTRKNVPSSIGGDTPLAAIQLGLNHQHQALSITPTAYLDLPSFWQSERKTENDETSSCDSSWTSISTQYRLPVPARRLDSENMRKQTFPEESPLPENNKRDLLLLKQLKEITLAALEVRDQTRAIIQEMDLIPIHQKREI